MRLPGVRRYDGGRSGASIDDSAVEDEFDVGVSGQRVLAHVVEEKLGGGNELRRRFRTVAAKASKHDHWTVGCRIGEAGDDGIVVSVAVTFRGIPRPTS